MLIRDADVTRDAAACAAIYAPFVSDSAVSFEEITPGAVDFARRIERIIRTHPWIVAEDGGHVIGYAYGAPHRERAAYRWATDVTVYIDQGHHRRGVGRGLYGSLLTLLREQGFHVACAGVTLPNDASVGLHRAMGFEEVGVYRRIGFKRGAWHDVAWFQLALRGPDEAPAEPGSPRRLGEPT